MKTKFLYLLVALCVVALSTPIAVQAAESKKSSPFTKAYEKWKAKQAGVVLEEEPEVAEEAAKAAEETAAGVEEAAKSVEEEAKTVVKEAETAVEDAEATAEEVADEAGDAVEKVPVEGETEEDPDEPVE